jgi:hypothetical protein
MNFSALNEPAFNSELPTPISRLISNGTLTATLSILLALFSFHAINIFMKRIPLFFLVISLTIAGLQVSAQDYRFAVGIRLSNTTPTLSNAITGKYFVTEKTAIEGIVSFGNRFGIGGLLEFSNPFSVEGLSWFYGAGAYVGFQDGSTYLGPTGIIGMDYKFANVPLNISLDWKPELDIIPSINFVPDAVALSVRFTIK